MDLREYGKTLLNKYLEIDSESYIDYAIELLNQDLAQAAISPSSQLYHFLLDCHLDEEVVQTIIEKFTTILKRGYANEEEVEDLQQPSSTSENNLDSAPTFSETDVTTEDDNEDDPLTNDVMNLTSYEVDWTSLIDSLESHLSTYYQYTQPEFSPPALMVALYKGYYQVDYAAQLLLNGVNVLNHCKPCRHLMQQGCFRRDCHFDHDLTHFPCRYWLHSVCANSPQLPQNATNSEDFLVNLTEKGSCVFSHDLPDFIPEYYVTNPTETNTATSAPTTIVEEEFPSLGKSTTSSSSTTKKSSDQYSSAIVRAQQPSTDTTAIVDFPSLSAASTMKNPKKQTTKSTYSTSISSTASRGGGSVASGGSYGTIGGSSSSQRKVFSDLLEKAQFIPTSTNGHSNRVKASEWVESGDVIRQDYEKLREEARQYAIGRNKLLQEATIAYMSGSKQSAKSLSAQGQAMNQQMKQLHIQ
eukprot:gene16881-19268_t